MYLDEDSGLLEEDCGLLEEDSGLLQEDSGLLEEDSGLLSARTYSARSRLGRQTGGLSKKLIRAE